MVDKTAKLITTHNWSQTVIYLLIDGATDTGTLSHINFISVPLISSS